LTYKNICDNVKKDGCLTLFFEFAILKDMVYSSLFDNDMFQIKDTSEKNHQISTGSMDLHRMHQESMKFLAENASLSDVVLVSAEKEEIQAHKNILAAHSRVIFYYLIIYIYKYESTAF
jgi:hypothetical protein